MFKKMLVIVILVLSGCSNDPYEKYIGFWEKQDIKETVIMEIIKDGETILMNMNIFRNKKPQVLNKSEGKLSIASIFGTIQLGLSEDKNILHMERSNYKHLSKNEVEQIKTKRALCQTKITTFETELKNFKKSYNDEYRKTKEGNNYNNSVSKHNEMIKEYKTELESLEYCPHYAFYPPFPSPPHFN